MTRAKYQRRREVIMAEMVDGTRDQAERLGYTRAWKSAQHKKDRKPPHKMLLKTLEGEIEIKIGEYIVFEGERGYTRYTAFEFHRKWEPYDQRVRVRVRDGADKNLINADLDMTVLIGEDDADEPDYAIVGGPNAMENLGRFVKAIEKPD